MNEKGPEHENGDAFSVGRLEAACSTVSYLQESIAPLLSRLRGNNESEALKVILMNLKDDPIIQQLLEIYDSRESDNFADRMSELVQSIAELNEQKHLSLSKLIESTVVDGGDLSPETIAELRDRIIQSGLPEADNPALTFPRDQKSLLDYLEEVTSR